jgi:hypothetical protein
MRSGHVTRRDAVTRQWAPNLHYFKAVEAKLVGHPPAAREIFVLSKGQKGKIPVQEWSVIATRHQQGESLASLARAYGCTAPAISYIVRRVANPEQSRSRIVEGRVALAGAAAPAVRAEPQEGPRAIDPQLRDRVHSDISTFLVAFDAACTKLNAETRARLLDATDRLLRAGARTRIELERLGALV